MTSGGDVDVLKRLSAKGICLFFNVVLFLIYNGIINKNWPMLFQEDGTLVLITVWYCVLLSHFFRYFLKIIITSKTKQVSDRCSHIFFYKTTLEMGNKNDITALAK